jgi:pyruvate kinase
MPARKMGARRQQRRTKIICTIGPATQSRTEIEQLAGAGMDVARLNFSYGSHNEHERTMANIRAVEGRLGRPIGILQDLAGVKLRVGQLPEEGMELRPGSEVVLSTSAEPAAGQISVSLRELPRALSSDQRLLLGDGNIELVVLDTTDTEIRCRVRAGGVLKSHQGLHVPDVRLPIKTVTEQDVSDLRFGLEHGADWVAMSFVQGPDDLLELRRRMERGGRQAPIMAKIERHEAIDNLDAIIEVADGVMVARGDLGIELPLDRVPMLQKDIIGRCNAAGKPVVTATQMLESMIHNPRPTRAEVSDVANAVLDGTDGVMLSGETAIGSYPVEAARVMARVAERAEAAFDFEGRLVESSQWPCRTVTDGISQATVNLAHDLKAQAIITATSTGHTALMVAMHRPEAPVIAVTSDVATQRRLTLAWGVYPVAAPRGTNTDELIVNAIDRARAAGLVRQRDVVVVTAGVPPGLPGRTNLVKVEVVGQHHAF